MKNQVKRNSIKEDANRLEEFVRKYRKACLYAEFYEKKILIINDKSDEEKLQKHLKYKEMFESFYDTLKEDEKLIIRFDFYDQVSENWWVSYYSRSTYYRIKNRAITKMLYYLD